MLSSIWMKERVKIWISRNLENFPGQTSNVPQEFGEFCNQIATCKCLGQVTNMELEIPVGRIPVRSNYKQMSPQGIILLFGINKNKNSCFSNENPNHFFRRVLHLDLMCAINVRTMNVI